jgi:hypothetical protein
VLEEFCKTHFQSYATSVVPRQAFEEVFRDLVPGSALSLLGEAFPSVKGGAKKQLVGLLEFLQHHPFTDQPVVAFECFCLVWARGGGDGADESPAATAEEKAEVAKDQAVLGSELFHMMMHLCCGLEKHGATSVILTSRVQQWRLQSAFSKQATAVWTNLYSTRSNGIGVGAFGRTLACYLSPTVWLLKTAAGDVLGAFSNVEWRSGPKYFGSGQTELFVVAPEKDGVVTKYTQTGVSHNYLYFHIPNSKATAKGLIPDGVGIGGQLEGFRVFVDADFKRGEAASYDSTFNNGLLVPLAAKEDPNGNSDLVGFEVGEIEVFGLGGQKALDEKLAREQIEIKEAMKRRQVNKKIMLGGEDEDNVDMWMLETTGAHTSFVKDADHVS